MQCRPLFAFLLLLLFATSVMSCKKDPEPAPSEVTSSLIGSWKLTHRFSMMSSPLPPTPVPDEMLKFTKKAFFIYQNGRLISEGIYGPALVTFFCGSSSGPESGLQFIVTRGVFFPGPNPVIYTVNDDRLHLNSSVCDAAHHTYERLR
jgi:hypothetical protein